MRYTVELNPSAQRDLARLESSISFRTTSKLRQLEGDPRPHGCVKMTGEERQYRIRVGEYRIVYEVDDRTRLVSVKRIQHRREVYR
jgi:mRNA interferase RelE/StbE